MSLYDYRLAVIQGLLPNNQNIPVNSKKRNCETHLPKKFRKIVKKDICTKGANIVIHREFVRILYIFVLSVKTSLAYV